jgi:putative addiction module component (TIGR02574 family)
MRPSNLLPKTKPSSGPQSLKPNEGIAPMLKIDIEQLSKEERLSLIEELWDSLAPTQDQVALSDAQRKELDDRIDEMDRDAALGIPWDQMLRQIREHA